MLMIALASVFIWLLPVFMGKGAGESVPFSMMGVELWRMPWHLSRVMAFIFWTIFSYWLVILGEKMELMPTRSSMPFVVGMLLSATVSGVQVFDNGMVAFILFVHAVMRMCRMYDVSNQVVEAFKVVVFIWLASLFRVEYIWFLLLYVAGLSVYKVVSFRIIVSSLLALATGLWLTWGFCYVAGTMDLFVDYVRSALMFDFVWKSGSWMSLLGIGFMTVMVMVSRISFYQVWYRYDLRVKLNNSAMGWLFWLSVGMLVVFASVAVGPLVFAAMVSLSLYFTAERNNFSNIMFLVLVAMMILIRVIELC